jgi:hypothetical protein
MQDSVSPLVSVCRVGVVRDQDDEGAPVVDADAAHVVAMAGERSRRARSFDLD